MADGGIQQMQVILDAQFLKTGACGRVEFCPLAAETQVDRALNSAIKAGCEELITACPLCLYNLVHNATGEKLPVKYFTELLAEALGVKEA